MDLCSTRSAPNNTLTTPSQHPDNIPTPRHPDTPRPRAPQAARPSRRGRSCLLITDPRRTGCSPFHATIRSPGRSVADYFHWARDGALTMYETLASPWLGRVRLARDPTWHQVPPLLVASLSRLSFSVSVAISSQWRVRHRGHRGRSGVAPLQSHALAPSLLIKFNHPQPMSRPPSQNKII